MNYKRMIAFVSAMVLCVANTNFIGNNSKAMETNTITLETQNKTAVDWELNETTGVLTISGTGPMKDYEAYYDNKQGSKYAPWYDFLKGAPNVKKVIIKSGVTSIGNYAFYNCQELEEVVIEGDIEKIGNYAFYQCKKLKQFSLPDSVVSIGGSSFSYCNSFTSFKVSSNLEFIGNYAFNGCSSLTKIEVSSDNPYYMSENGILFSKDKKVLVQYPAGKKDTSYTVPDGVEEIGLGAFESNLNITNVKLPDSVTTISRDAFNYAKNLEKINITDSVTEIGYHALRETKVFNSAPVSSGMRIYNGFLLEYTGESEKLSIPTSVKTIVNHAFSVNSSLKSITIPENCRVNTEAFYGCSALTTVNVKNGAVLDSGCFNDCSSLQNIYLEGNNIIKGSICIKCNKDVSINYDRPVLKYTQTANEEGKSNIVSSDSVKLTKSTIKYSSYGDRYAGKFNNGFESVDALQEITDSSGEIYCVVKSQDGAALISKDSEEIQFTMNGFEFGSAVFDDEDNLYILWAHTVKADDLDEFVAAAEENIVVCKYSKSGKLISQVGFPITDLNAQYPFSRGNAHLGWNDGVLLCFIHTEWTKGVDGLNHQGAVSAGIKTDTMSKIMLNKWEGSHSFGSTMIPTDYGFALIEMGDGNRGFNAATFYVNDGKCKTSYMTDNGKNVIFHASGKYGSNEKHIDGNITYLHMGGLAKSNTTYAAAGKAERNYTTNTFYNSSLHNGIYDVFVRIIDQTFQNINTDSLAGVDRVDKADGSVDDKNVVWLTECNENEKAGNVKIVTLEDGAYCILWEKYVDDKFDSIRYVITDECGNIIREETAAYGGRLSNTSIQPVVKNNTLEWAVCDDVTNEITWNSLDLDALTDAASDDWKKDILKGDVNGDGIVDQTDSEIVIQMFLNIDGYTREQIYAADVNDDGIINTIDASIIVGIYNETFGIKGDANCDGTVNMSDAVLIMQSTANPNKYGLYGTDETHITEKGMRNADVNGNGVTNSDALEIQRLMLGLIDDFD